MGGSVCNNEEPYRRILLLPLRGTPHYADLLIHLSECRCWLVELAQESPQTWQLEGYDVNANHLPATEYLPRNVTMRILDIFDDIPDELVEKFDVVHVRVFAAIIKNNDPNPFLKNIMRLLSKYNFALRSWRNTRDSGRKLSSRTAVGACSSQLA